LYKRLLHPQSSLLRLDILADGCSREFVFAGLPEQVSNSNFLWLAFRRCF